ncbi:type I polyketide synthase, partial [Streptomyces sp. NPDC059894]|uniref:type I polyketide synthase n=1 Tax=Streptomyces sp. NPDC059894 TaxID=3346991 RepID=UPI0036539D13
MLEDAVVLTRREGDEVREVLAGLGELFGRGVDVDWGPLLPPGETVLDLPTYAFQHRRYWILDASGGGDVTALGLTAADHPLLGALVELPHTGGLAFTSRISTASQPWLADHAAGGSLVVPAAALVDLAIAAGDRAGTPVLTELTVDEPLLLPDRDALRLHIAVSEPDDDGHRTLAVYSAPDGAGDELWRRHAVGVLTPQGGPVAAPDALATWPPDRAEPIDLTELTARTAALGYEYGPAFGALRAAWRRGDELFAYVALGEEQWVEAARYGIHPALLDAAWQAALPATAPDRTVPLPAGIRGAVLHASAATTLRVRLSPDGSGGVSLLAADDDGAPVLAVDSVTTVPFATDRLGTTTVSGPDALFRMDWEALPDLAAPADGPGADPQEWSAAPDAEAIDALADRVAGGAAAPRWAVLPVPAGGFAADRVLDVTTAVLTAAQAFLRRPELDDVRLVVLTRGAVEAVPGSLRDPSGAAVWGLVRAAQAENPDRILLTDVPADGAPHLSSTGPLSTGPLSTGPLSTGPLSTGPFSTGPLSAGLAAALAAAADAGEWQVAVREDTLYVPRLARPADPAADGPAPRAVRFDPEGVVLLTGGTGSLGSLVARRLVAEHGVRHLVLAGRRGPAADGAAALVAALTEAGATATVVACDVTDRDAVAALLDDLPDGRRLTGVVHLAGVAGGGTLPELDAARLAYVFAPKVAATAHLDELTRERHPDLDAFVMFSSISGSYLGEGTGNYAAANAYLDAVALARHAAGLPGLSLAWGPWQQETGMAAGYDEAGLVRMRRRGATLLPQDEGLRLFDTALRGGEPLLLPIKLDLGLARANALASGSTVPSLLRGLVRPIRRVARARLEQTSAPAAGLAGRLAAMSPAEGTELLLGLIRTQVAGVLGHTDVGQVEPDRAFRDIGFDSLTAVELRNRLREGTGLALHTSVVFDYPTPLALARHLRDELAGDQSTPAAIAPMAATGASDEPIAIVGMSCRLPGGVRGPAEFWDLVREGRDGMGPFPTDRGWDLDRLFDDDPEHQGTSYVRQGGFLHDAARFDAAFFGISPREALAMDPQQRLLLEGSWEALEHAGIDPDSLRGTDVGLFAGVFGQAYGFGSAGAAEIEGFMATGSAGSVASGRVSYAFGFEGPAVTIDTACSSSLVAIHLAAQALRSGECSMALAGGVTVMPTPGTFVEFSRQRGLAPDGRCKPFAAAADGTGWAEGVGLVVLERLSEAERLGHRILGVVKGSAVNQDGASNGLTAPNGPAQQRVIRRALAAAGISAAEVDAVEAHGTGTTLGDPIEAQALLATYGRDRDPEHPLWLGSVKSNIGHTQAAAGVAGVIKMVQALRHAELPATLHVDEPTHEVDWSAGGVRLLTEPRPWVRDGRPRRAAVSAFGISGTNAHVVIEEAPVRETATTDAEPVTAPAAQPVTEPAAQPVTAPAAEPVTEAVAASVTEPGTGLVPLIVSARGSAALAAQADALARHLETTEADLPAVARALRSRRAALPDRAAVIAASTDEAVAGLVSITAAASRVDGRTVFVFPGQGAQWFGMGRELLAVSPVFAAEIDR